MPGSNGSGPRKPQLPGTIRAARLKPAIFTPTERAKMTEQSIQLLHQVAASLLFSLSSSA